MIWLNIHVFGPLQARPLFFVEHMLQTPGSHGSGLSYAAHGAASYEAIYVVKEVQRSLSLMVSPLPTKTVTQLFLRPLDMTGLSLSSAGCQDGLCLLLPNDYYRRIHNWLELGL